MQSRGLLHQFVVQHRVVGCRGCLLANLTYLGGFHVDTLNMSAVQERNNDYAGHYLTGIYSSFLLLHQC